MARVEPAVERGFRGARGLVAAGALLSVVALVAVGTRFTNAGPLVLAGAGLLAYGVHRLGRS